MVYRRSFSRLAVVALAALFTSTLLAASCAGPEALAPDEPVASVSQRLDPEHPWMEQQRIQTEDTLAYTYFGCAVAIDPDEKHALIGGYRADHDRGAGYVFAWSDELKKWVQEARLKSPNGQTDDQMGNTVAIAGDVAVVGAPSGNAAYVFEKTNGIWVFTKKILNPDLNAVAVTRDRIFIAGQSKSISIYMRSANNQWGIKEIIDFPSDIVPGNIFGYSLAVDGDRLAVGVLGYEERGEVRVYKRDGSTWGQEAVLTSKDSTVGSYLGYSIALSGTTIVAGAPKLPGLSTEAGGVVVFTYDGSTWSQQAVLSDEGVGMMPSNYRRLGATVAISGDTLVAGRMFSYGSMDPGNYELWQFTDNYAYRFERIDGAWTPAVRFKGHDTPTPPAGQLRDNGGIFGSGIAISERWLIVGDPEADTYFGNPANNDRATDDPGATYIFTRRGQPCMTDADCSTGYCVDEVCCQSACDLPCQACSASKKGGGVDGDCGPVPVGTYENVCGDYVCGRTPKGGADAGAATDAGADAGAACTGESCFEGGCLTHCESSADCKSGYCDLDDHKCATIDPVIEFDQGCGCRTAPGSTKAPSGLAAASLLAVLGLAARRSRRRAQDRALAPASAPRAWTLSSALAIGVGASALGCGVEAGLSEGEAIGVAASPAESGAIALEVSVEIVAESPTKDNTFGYAIAASGDTIVVGAPQKSGASTRSAAYAFTREGEAWRGTKLPADGTEGPSFGKIVAISGDTIAVGAPHDPFEGVNDAGVVHLFQKVDDKWTLEATLSAEGGAAENGNFGAAVALGSEFGSAMARGRDFLAIGEPHRSLDANTTDVGQVYTYVRDPVTKMWGSVQKLISASGPFKFTESDEFGSSLAISGPTLIVGAPNYDLNGESDTGALHVFTRTPDTWQHQTVVAPKAGGQGDHLGGCVAVDNEHFGSCLAADRDRIVASVGASGKHLNDAYVYVFARQPDGSYKEQTLDSGSTTTVTDSFGSSVAISGDTVFVGARSALGAEGTKTGAAYVFALRNGMWQSAKITTQNGLEGDTLGAAVATSGLRAFLGAPAHLVERANLDPSLGAVEQVLLGTFPSCAEGNQSVPGMSPGQTSKPVVSDCRAYRCNPDTGACWTECTETSQCAAGYFCDTDKCVEVPGKDLGPKSCVASVARGGDAPASLSWSAWGTLGLVALLRARGRRGARTRP